MIRTRSTLQVVIQILYAGSCRVEWMAEGTWPRRFGMIGDFTVASDYRVRVEELESIQILFGPVGKDKTALIFWGSMNEVVLERYWKFVTRI